MKKFLMMLSLAAVSCLYADTHKVFDETQFSPSNIWIDKNSTKFYFTYDDGEHGQEIYVSDGTLAGTHMVGDLQQGSDPSIDVYNAIVINNRLLFYWNEQGKWYITDGTEEGTEVFTDDVNDTFTYSTTFALDPYDSVKIGNVGIYALNFNDIGDELLITDGTKNGTFRMDLNPGSAGSNANNFYITPDGKHAYFLATTADNGRELWVTDGTKDGTHMVKDIIPGSDSGMYYYQYLGFVDGGKLLFKQEGYNDDYYNYWITDGTEAGTYKIFDGTQYVPSKIWTDKNSKNFYFTYDDGEHGKEIYVSDGTLAGTHMIADLQQGSDTSIDISNGFVINNRFVFYWDQQGKWYVTDGTEEGTQVFTDDENNTFTSSVSFNLNSDYSAKIGNVYLFNMSFSDIGTELLFTDGTKEGTFRVDLNPGAAGSSPTSFHVSPDGKKVFFKATTGAYGSEMWVSDGTVGGTKLLLDADYGTNSGLYYYYIYGFVGGNLLFRQKGSTQSIYSYWLSDGTPYEDYSACIDLNTTYTKEDLDNAYNEGIEEGKKICKLDPAACGITNTVAPLDSDMLSSLSSGWHMVGTSLPITDFTIFKDVNTVWYYNPDFGKWEVYSPDAALEYQINNSTYVLPLKEIKAYTGFWIFK